MCGLAGHNTSQQSTFAHAALLAQLAHRGPDAKAHWGERGADLYHNRLSIIDNNNRTNQPNKFYFGGKDLDFLMLSFTNFI